jgi:hypothetical protein
MLEVGTQNLIRNANALQRRRLPQLKLKLTLIVQLRSPRTRDSASNRRGLEPKRFQLLDANMANQSCRVSDASKVSAASNRLKTSNQQTGD